MTTFGKQSLLNNLSDGSRPKNISIKFIQFRIKYTQPQSVRMPYSGLWLKGLRKIGAWSAKKNDEIFQTSVSEKRVKVH